MPTHRKFLSLAIPNVLTNLTVPLAGLLDMAFLGHQDTVFPLAGVALAAVIFDYLYWSFGFLRMGTTGLAATAYGEGNKQEEAAVLWRALLLAILISTFILILQSPIGNISFAMLNGGEEVESAGRAYYDARIWGAIPALCLYACFGWLLGRQRPTAVLIVATVLNGLNIALDYYFIMVKGWGAAGAGYATAIAEWVAFGTALFFIRRVWTGLPAVPWQVIRQAAAFSNMLRLSGDLMIRTFCLITIFALFTNLSASFGEVALAGNAVLLHFLTMAAYGVDGFAFALESLAGYYAGAKEHASRKKALTMALKWSLLISALFIVIVWLNGRFFLGLLTIHEPVIAHGMEYIHFLCALIFIGGFAYIYDGYFIGLAKGKILRNSMMISLGLGFMPWVLMLHYSPSINILWGGLISFTVLRGFTLHRASMRMEHEIDAAQIERPVESS